MHVNTILLQFALQTGSDNRLIRQKWNAKYLPRYVWQRRGFLGVFRCLFVFVCSNMINQAEHLTDCISLAMWTKAATSFRQQESFTCCFWLKTCGFWIAITMVGNFFLTTPPDRLHYPHSGLCLCLPSRGAAHLQRTQRVSVATRVEAQSPPKETWIQTTIFYKRILLHNNISTPINFCMQVSCGIQQHRVLLNW